MNHIFGYARVSTIDQNLDTQLEALEKQGCHKIFKDKILGTSISRPALDEMLAQLREGDTVIVAKFNRLGRSTTHLINLVNDFAKKGIHFRALDFGIDTTTPTGRLMLTFFAALSEYERETILEKTRAGQLLAKAKGKHVGRPAKINEEKYTKVKKALENGISVIDTSKITGISLTTVKRYRRLIEKKLSHPAQLS
jgi:DNA invertase Pin-like site-specific DNA recombinase